MSIDRRSNKFIEVIENFLNFVNEKASDHERIGFYCLNLATKKDIM